MRTSKTLCATSTRIFICHLHATSSGTSRPIQMTWAKAAINDGAGSGNAGGVGASNGLTGGLDMWTGWRAGTARSISALRAIIRHFQSLYHQSPLRHFQSLYHQSPPIVRAYPLPQDTLLGTSTTSRDLHHEEFQCLYHQRFPIRGA